MKKFFPRHSLRDSDHKSRFSQAVGTIGFLILGLLYAQDFNQLPLSKLSDAESVFAAGKILMEQPMGWTEITAPKSSEDTLWIVVHGYGSKGYEWVTAIKDFRATGDPVFIYRYDWNRCPGSIADSLSADLRKLLGTLPSQPKHILVFGHSYGALITAMLDSRVSKGILIEFHAIAGPLAGLKGFKDECSPDQSWIQKITENETGPRIHQWRTVQSEDGAYRDAETNPEDVDIPGSVVTQLPKTMDGHRLGHNWSVQWVAETFLGLRKSAD